MKIRKKIWLMCLAMLFTFSAMSQTTEYIRGLTVVVDFKDAPFRNSVDSVAMMMNQPGFSGWGNVGSVRDYFYVQSNKKVNVTSTVIKVSLPYNVSDYYGSGSTRHDITDIAAAINQNYKDGFQNLTINPGDVSIKHFNVVSRASKSAWAFKKQDGILQVKNNGQLVNIVEGNITTYNSYQNPEHNTICHETGHSLFGWPDLYQTAWTNLGSYCSMASAGTEARPMPINPALRLQKGWINHVIQIGNTTQTFLARSNSYDTIYKYTNPYNSREYLLIQPQVYGGYYQKFNAINNVPDQGLAIYYVDEEGGMDLPGIEQNLFIKLLQADNVDEMQDEDRRELDVRGDLNDLYDNLKPSFPNGTPFRWKDGGEFGLFITGISAPGQTISFTVNARPNTFIAKSDKNGTISPSGVISALNGQSKTFTFTPKPGYEINQVKQDGLVVSTGSSFTTTASGTKTIEVTFKRKATLDQLPSPWQTADIGTASASGLAGHVSGKFNLETFGDQNEGSTVDNFRFVYQPINGDVTIIANLNSSNKPKFWSKAGIMIRGSLQADAAQTMLVFTPRNNIRVQQRNAAGASMIDDPNGIPDKHFYQLYKWLKIVRTGNTFTSSVSRDKITWVQMAQQNIAMGNVVYVGMAVLGANGNYASKAMFDNVSVVPAVTQNISGPACGNNNQTLVYELALSKRANATGFNWTYSGSKQNISTVSGTLYKANLLTGSYFSAGEVCVGVNYSSSPWYATYCIPVTKCASAREGEAGFEVDDVSATAYSFPNPFTSETTLLLGKANAAKVQVYNAQGSLLQELEGSGSFQLGNGLDAGIYFVRINSGDKIETLKIIKE